MYENNILIIKIYNNRHIPTKLLIHFHQYHRILGCRKKSVEVITHKKLNPIVNKH